MFLISTLLNSVALQGVHLVSYLTSTRRLHVSWRVQCMTVSISSPIAIFLLCLSQCKLLFHLYIYFRVPKPWCCLYRSTFSIFSLNYPTIFCSAHMLFRIKSACECTQQEMPK